jgi:lipid-A-disaccharide synthase-like uncharacterized protein
MIVAIIIIAYVLSVFLNRWLNKIMFKKYDEVVIVEIWFIPILGTFLCLSNFLLCVLDNIPQLTDWMPKLKSNWFTGKYWK